MADMSGSAPTIERLQGVSASKFAVSLLVAALLSGLVVFLAMRMRGSGVPAGAISANVDAGVRRKAYTSAELGEIYKAEFAAEVRDPVWADAAERDYRPAIEAQLPNTSRLVAFECRVKFCRMELVHDSLASSNEFLMRLFSPSPSRNSLPASLGRVTGGFRAAPPTPTSDGKLGYLVFIARPGVSTAVRE
jgi:hypothetical protein